MAVLATVFDRAVVVAQPSSAVAKAATSEAQHTYLVPGSTPIGWDKVRELNKVGLLVSSRAVIEHPPVNWEASLSDPNAFDYGSSNDGTTAVYVLVVFSIVLEVVLLAGPAFAVGVRRQRRQLALLAATGGTARDVRRVVLTQALTTGAFAAALGALLGLPVAAVIIWAIPRVRPESTLGPFDISWVPMLVAAALGAFAAVAAAYFPARSAARQDVVAVLAGRRGQVRSRRGLPLLGLAMLGIGAALALVKGTKQGGEYWVVGGTLVMVLGAIALMPAVVGGIGRLGRVLPLPLRLATRDSARQRGRTAPAVAAVMAAVAGVTALAIGASSDFAQSRRDYQPRLAPGITTVQASNMDAAWWSAANVTTQSLAPGRELLPTGEVGVNHGNGAGWPGLYVAPKGCPKAPPESEPGQRDRLRELAVGRDPPQPETGYNQTNSLVAGPQALAALGYRLDDRQRAVLAGGGVLVPPGAAIVDGRVDVLSYDVLDDSATPSVTNLEHHRLRAATIQPLDQYGMKSLVGVVLTPETAKAFGRPLGPDRCRALAVRDPAEPGGAGQAAGRPAGHRRVRGGVHRARLRRELRPAAAGPDGRGRAGRARRHAHGDRARAGDSRPDAATLAAIGARPRTRRSMAAAQAVVIGLLGSLAGILVGFVPGLAVTWPLTAEHYRGGGPSVWGSPTINVPWMMLLAIGVGVPLLAATAAGLGVRSRLPLTRRLGQ